MAELDTYLESEDGGVFADTEVLSMVMPPRSSIFIPYGYIASFMAYQEPPIAPKGPGAAAAKAKQDDRSKLVAANILSIPMFSQA